MSSQPNHDLTWYYFNYDSLLPQQMYKLISDYWIVTLFLFSETCVLKAFHLCHWWNNETICYNFDNRKYTAKCKNWSLNYKKAKLIRIHEKKKRWENECRFDKTNRDYVFA